MDNVSGKCGDVVREYENDECVVIKFDDDDTYQERYYMDITRV